MSIGGGTFSGLSNHTGTETSTDCFTDSDVSTISQSGSSNSTFIQQGTYGGYSFAFGTVVDQSESSFNGTFQDSYTSTDFGTVNDSFTYSGNQTGSGTFNTTALNGVGTSVQYVQETYTSTETSTSVTTNTVSDTATMYEQGSFARPAGAWPRSITRKPTPTALP